MRSRKLQKFQIYAVRTVAILVLVTLTFLFGRGALKMYGRYTESTATRAGAELQLLSLQKREVELQKTLSKLSSQRGMEEELRKRFGVAAPGEGVIEIVQPTTTPSKEEGVGGIFEWFKNLF